MGEKEKRGPEREPDGVLTSGEKGRGSGRGKSGGAGRREKAEKKKARPGKSGRAWRGGRRRGKGAEKAGERENDLVVFWWPEWERKKREGRKGNQTGF